MKKIISTLTIILFSILPSVSSAAALTQQQSTSLIAVVQSSPGTPASAFISLITAFSNITTNQAASLITVIQAAPGVPANAFVNLLTSFTVDTPTTQAVTPVPTAESTVHQSTNTNTVPNTPTPTPSTTAQNTQQIAQNTCTPSWQCANWSTCLSSTQTRTCTDSNNCGTTTKKPSLTQSCTMSTPISSPPTLTLTASPTFIIGSGSSNLSWSSVNADSCSASGAWSGTKGVSGNQYVSPSQTSTYTLTCSGSGGVVSKSVMIIGQPSITITTDSATPATGTVIACSRQNALAAFRFTETSNNDGAKITDLTLHDTVGSTANVKASFSNLSLYSGSTLLGTAGAAVASSPNTYDYAFHFATPVSITQAGSVTLILKGDVGSNISSLSPYGYPVYYCDSYTDNSVHAFGIANPTDVVALGQSSNTTFPAIVSSANGNPQNVLRERLKVSVTPSGLTSGRAKATTDDLATINFTTEGVVSGGYAGGADIFFVTITFDGSAPSTIPGFYNIAPTKGSPPYYFVIAPTCSNCMVQLFKAGVNGVAGDYGTFYPTATGPNSLTFGLGAENLNSTNFILRVNSATGTNLGTLSAKIAGTSDVVWADGMMDLSGSWYGFNNQPAWTYGIGLPASTVPINIQSVSYAN